MQARSIHIGAGTFAWPGGDQPSPLPDVAFSATRMSKLCAEAGITALPPLVDDHADIAAVSAAITAAAVELAPDALLVITYTGHGAVRAAIDEPGNDEPRDQAWCLHDGLLRDNDLRRLLAKLPAAMRVLVISDACHMGTINHAIGEPDLELVERLAPREVVRQWFADDDARRGAAPAPTAELARPAIVAASIFLGACGDDDLAVPGLFTRTLIDTWDAGGFVGDHRQYFDEVAARMVASPAQQQPTFTLDGTDVERFVAQPFTP